MELVHPRYCFQVLGIELSSPDFLVSDFTYYAILPTQDPSFLKIWNLLTPLAHTLSVSVSLLCPLPLPLSFSGFFFLSLLSCLGTI